MQLSLNLPLHEALPIDTSHSETGLNRKYASLVKDKNRLRKYTIYRPLVHAKDNSFPVLWRKKKETKQRKKVLFSYKYYWLQNYCGDELPCDNMSSYWFQFLNLIF